MLGLSSKNVSDHGSSLSKLMPTSNHLLCALSDDAQLRLFPKLTLVQLTAGRVLTEPGDIVQYVYFPIDAIVSLMLVMKNGASAEISIIGNEGLIGIALFTGGGSTLSRTVVQSAGYAYRLPAKKILREFNRHESLSQLLLPYTQSLLTQMAQTAVCNRHHHIHQQLCRWLLLCLDRLPGNQIHVTHEYIANMLGVRREGVSEAAAKLQRSGVIKYHRGHITVLDRPRLEQLSCECYAIVRQESDRLAHLR